MSYAVEMAARRMIPLCLLSILVACASPSKPSDSDTLAAPVEDAGGAGDPGADGQVCAADVDCVPAQCCHPTTCVPASQAPDCSDIACTEECQGGTMDCGQGHCSCQEGACTAVIDNPL